MKFVNPEINTSFLYKSPDYVVKEKIRKIVCDEYGLEGDCTIEEMIDKIFSMIMTLEIW